MHVDSSHVQDGITCIMDLPKGLLSYLFESIGLWETDENLACMKSLEDMRAKPELHRDLSLVKSLSSGFVRILTRKDNAFTLGHAWLHAGMVCKQWRELCRIGGVGPVTAEAVVKSLGPYSHHVDPIRVAMRAAVISEEKHHVFCTLLDMWIRKEGKKGVAMELVEPCKWTRESLGLDPIRGDFGPGETGAPSWLCLAAEFGRPEIASLLVSSGAIEGLKKGRYDWGSSDHRYSTRCSPILPACSANTQSHSSVLKILAEAGASISVPMDDFSFLHVAAESNSYEGVKAFLDLGMDPNTPYYHGHQDAGDITPLDRLSSAFHRQGKSAEWLALNEQIAQLLRDAGGHTTDIPTALAAFQQVKAQATTINEQASEIEALGQQIALMIAHRNECEH